MRPISLLSVMGTGFPILLGGLAAIDDLPALGIVAFVFALVLPSLGHIVYRRTIRTRGFYTRLVGTCLAGLFVLAAQGAKDLGGSIAMVIAAMLSGIVLFCVGAALDIIDAERTQLASAARSRNV